MPTATTAIHIAGAPMPAMSMHRGATAGQRSREQRLHDSTPICPQAARPISSSVGGCGDGRQGRPTCQSRSLGPPCLPDGRRACGSEHRVSNGRAELIARRTAVTARPADGPASLIRWMPSRRHGRRCPAAPAARPRPGTGTWRPSGRSGGGQAPGPVCQHQDPQPDPPSELHRPGGAAAAPCRCRPPAAGRPGGGAAPRAARRHGPGHRRHQDRPADPRAPDAGPE